MDPGDDSLLERHAEMALLEGCLNGAADGTGSVLLLEGPSGLGKTRLLQAATAQAEQRGFRVLAAGATERDHHFGFGVAVELLESVPRSANRAHPLTLLKILDGDGGLDAVFALHRRLEELTSDRPLLVALDDAQWADAPSLRWLLFAAQRAIDTPLAIVVATTPGTPDAHDDLLTRLAESDLAHKADLEALSPSGTAALVDRRFPAAPRVLVDAVHEATDGNPLLVDLLLDELGDRDESVLERAAADVTGATPATIVAGAVRRLQQLPAPAPAVASAVAVLGSHATVDLVASLAGISSSDVAAGLKALAGSLLESSAEPRFKHPAVARAVYGAIEPGEREQLHAAAAELLAANDLPPQRVAGHLLAAGPRSNANVVARLRAAAAEANAQGSPSSAVRFLQRALDEPPDAAALPDVLMELGEAEALSGSDRVVEHLERALELRGDAVARAETLARLGAHLTELGQHVRARTMFARALQEPDLPPGMAATLRTAEFSIALTDGSTAVEDLEPLLGASQSSAVEAVGPASGAALTQLALAHVFTSRDADSARDLALRGLQEMAGDSGASLYAGSIALSCLIWCEELDVAESAIAESMDEARRRGAMMSMAYVSLGRSWINYWRGRVAKSEEDARTAVDAWSGGWSMHLPIAGASQALALVELDRPDDAIAVVDRVLASRTRDSDFAGAWLPHHEPLLLHARGRAELARGDAEAAARDLVEVTNQQSPFTHNPAVLPWRSDAAIALSLTGDTDRARELVEEETALALRFGAPRPIGVARRASALVEGGPAAVALLTDAVASLERSPARIELVRALVDLGAALRRNGRRAAAKEALKRALHVEDTTTAVALRRRAAAELAAP